MKIIKSIQSRIYEIRGERVMLDRDLAVLYEIEVKVLNQAVKRNSKRFPKDFMFQLTKEEFEEMRFQVEATEAGNSLRSQIVTLKTQILDWSTLRGQTEVFKITFCDLKDSYSDAAYFNTTW